ncbi:hypothetical protein LCGC14_0660000 [marine sediment metagenome]|uniref:HEPN domain-containing protein n=1 Tax=marine sediment metagenome TaxID=412755 RepID=A0A0F9TF93_9ZZZZ
MKTKKPNNKEGTSSILNHAKDLYKMAIEEFKEAKNGNWDKIMDSAEKAWCTTTNACEVLLRTGVKVLKKKLNESFYTRKRLWIYNNGEENEMFFDHDKLDFLVFNNEEVKVDYYYIYLQNMTSLHGDCFYNGYKGNKQKLEQLIRMDTKKFLDFSEEFFNKHFM